MNCLKIFNRVIKIVFTIISLYATTCLAKCLTTTPIRTNDLISDVSVSDKDVIAAANYAINSFYKGPIDYVLLSAKQQLVAGMKYYLNVTFPNTQEQCEIQLIYKNWLEQYTDESKTCYAPPGSFTQASIKDQNMIDDTEYAISQLYTFNKTFELVNAQTKLESTVFFVNLALRFPDTGEVCEISIQFPPPPFTIPILNTCSGAPSSINAIQPVITTTSGIQKSDD